MHPPGGSEKLLRLHRGILLILLFKHARQESFKDIGRIEYKPTLQTKMHPWISEVHKLKKEGALLPPRQSIIEGEEIGKIIRNPAQSKS